MPKTILIIGTLDTKGAEIAYLRDRIQELGLETIVLDDGILGEPLGIELVPDRDITRAEAARYGGTTIEALRNAGSRGKAVDGMREAVKTLTLEYYQ
ncbi:MAG: Tm-1-like ATP-binding domain-containing protein, partial [Anaerolineales bacterium]|nr:Tm-1-like ATP-binding domain-containing protein [Anaerolineales bacterium]